MCQFVIYAECMPKVGRPAVSPWESGDNGDDGDSLGHLGSLWGHFGVSMGQITPISPISSKASMASVSRLAPTPTTNHSKQAIRSNLEQYAAIWSYSELSQGDGVCIKPASKRRPGGAMT